MNGSLTARLSAVPAVVWAALAGALVALLLLSAIELFHAGQAGASAERPSPRWGWQLDGRPAPNFTLVDQFGRTESLASFHGREVVLAFVDAKCTATCPLTAEILRDARDRLAARDAKHVALVAVNANPVAHSVHDAYSWSLQHHMLHQWAFLTGSPTQLRRVYHLYRLYDVVDKHGNVTHDAEVLVIDGHGRERVYFSTPGNSAQSIVASQVDSYVTTMRTWLPA